jgi:hypothetical protein
MAAKDGDRIKFEQYAKATYEGTKQYHQFITDYVIPVIESVLIRTEYEEALTAVYYQSHLLLRSLAKLDRSHDFQAVRSIARSMYELLLDMKTLEHDPTLSKRFFAFPTIERTKTAIRVADFVAKNATPARQKKYKHEIRLAGDGARIKECEDLLLNVYGIKTDIGTERTKRFPKSWTTSDVRAKAAKLGIDVELTYLAGYSIASWFVHGGFAGISGISHEGLTNVYGLGHHLAQGSCHSSTFIIAKALKLFDAQPDLWANLKALESYSSELFHTFMSQRMS